MTDLLARLEVAEASLCSTCPDSVPAVMPPEGWTCPECDAEWGDDDDAATTHKAEGAEG